MIKGPDVDEIIKRLVLAHADGDLKGIACVFVNAENHHSKQDYLYSRLASSTTYCPIR